MELNFALLAVSLRLPVGCQDLNLWQPDSPIFSSAISMEQAIATAFSHSGSISSDYNSHDNPKRHRSKRSC
ncbi:MAG TPA: hypothetical protein V6C57_21520 [Coleofasciculaceae cyanobacterium]